MLRITYLLSVEVFFFYLFEFVIQLLKVWCEELVPRGTASS